MPSVPPITASGSRDLAKPRPIPPKVRRMIEIMVRGTDAGDVVDFIGAAKLAGLAPDVARRWLDRGPVRQLLRAERAAFRSTLCASNELHLARIRGTARNSMAQIAAVRTLEQIDDQADVRSPREQPQAGLVVIIEASPHRMPAPTGPVVDVMPAEPVRSVTPAVDREPELEPPRPAVLTRPRR
jgi:hypothetical protein